MHQTRTTSKRAHLLKQEGGRALAAVHTVKVGGHECTGAALGALLAHALHLARVVHLVCVCVCVCVCVHARMHVCMCLCVCMYA